MRNTASVPTSVHSSSARQVRAARRGSRRRSRATGRRTRARAEARRRRPSMPPSCGSIMLNSVTSCRFVPTSRCTPSALPPSIASSGGWGSEVPSTTGWNDRPPLLGDAVPRFVAASMSCSIGTARSASTSPGATPSLRDDLLRDPGRASRVSPTTTTHRSAGSPCGTARVRRATPSNVPTEPPPADSPNTVTFVGIAAERGDRVADPLERGDLVEDARVAGSFELGVRTGRRGARTRTAPRR